jgi:hypothetical protein
MNASDYSAYFRDLADHYNNSRIPSSISVMACPALNLAVIKVALYAEIRRVFRAKSG